MKRIRSLLISILAIFSFAPMLAPAIASAATDSADNLACGVEGDLAGTTDCSSADTVNADSSINSIIETALRIFQIVVGIVSVVMIVMGGLRYITSGGETTAVGTAKNTILYALVGIVVVALAEIIIQFVLNRANNAGSGTF